ncbi:phosphoribosyltransferase [Microbacterium elymi]|uniref:Phosphoribosyltransferase family protein n=1 Tax=Microbacterium elymi TaxID=2909587 RepID=A0ABY5NJR7_9MICO|nr:phosphoribosyltransferase family protein [Microbacterium elymi]UUT35413.1 phosphoribosyltransferase family protein [Microbacterium elymi]
MALFADRSHAGRELAGSLAAWRSQDAVVAGIARGGVAVAAAVADKLALPLTAVAVRKLGVPGHEELALGAIAAGVRIVDERALRATRTSARELDQVEKRERERLARRHALLDADAPTVGGRAVLLVDDGIATGATANAAARALRRDGASRIVLAVPVAPTGWTPEPDAVDEYVCPHPMDDFWAVGRFYDDFTQTSDDDVIALLARGR